jgi:hypothetical protein
MERPAKFVPVGMRETGVVKGPEKLHSTKTFNNHKVPQLNEHNLT